MVLSILFYSLLSFAQITTQKIDDLLQAYTVLYQFNGTALVAKGDSILLNKGYGFKNAVARTEADSATIYQIGSVTKQFTATVIMRLQEEGKLSVNDKLSQYFPHFPNGNKISLHQLLTHTSGIYNYTNNALFMKTGATQHATPEKIMALFQNQPLEFEPGTQYRYSNSGYMLLGYIIEKVTGKKYEQVVRETIFKPLGMHHSGFDFARLKSKDKATGYYVYTENKKVPVPALVDSSVSFAAGAIYTTTGDLLKWERAITQQKILQPASWNAILTPEREHYGYGIMIDSLYGRLRIGHDGGIFGFNSMVVNYLQDGYIIVLLNNVNTPHLSKIANQIGAILYGQPYEIPIAKKEIKLTTAALQPFVGEYQFTPDFKIVISLNNGHLTGQATNQSPFELYAETPNRFFVKVVEAEIAFDHNTDGEVTGMILYQNGTNIKAKKIK